MRSTRRKPFARRVRRPTAQNFNGGGVKSVRSMPRQVDMTRCFRTGLEQRAPPPPPDVHRPHSFLTPQVGGCRIAFHESDAGQSAADAGPRFP